MKTYEVLFDPHAQAEAFAAADYIAQDSPERAAKWFAGFTRAINSLSTMPMRCAQARESKTLGVDLRHYIYRSHRIIFRVEEEAGIVRILHVRHAARRTIGEVQAEEDEG